MQNEPLENHDTSQDDHDAPQNTRKKPPKISSAALMLLIFMFISQIAVGIYAGLEIEPSSGFTFLQYIVLFWLIGDWLIKDNRHHKVDWVFNMGFSLYVAWPLIIPFYLFKTRGVKTLLIILGFVEGYIGAALIGMLVSFLFLA
jgi:hypothetical protein